MSRIQGMSPNELAVALLGTIDAHAEGTRERERGTDRIARAERERAEIETQLLQFGDALHVVRDQMIEVVAGVPKSDKHPGSPWAIKIRKVNVVPVSR